MELAHAVNRINNAGRGMSDCRVYMDSGTLVVDGLPHAWRQSPLIQAGPDLFYVQSMPLQVRFDPDGLCLTGPDLLDGSVDYRFIRVEQGPIQPNGGESS